MKDHKTHKEIQIRSYEITDIELSSMFNKDKYVIRKILDYLNVVYREIYRCQYPTRVYKTYSILLLKGFLHKHKNTRIFFCKLHNRSSDPEVINKIVYKRTHRSKKEKNETHKKLLKTREQNKTNEKSKVKRRQRSISNCPKGYVPLCLITEKLDNLIQTKSNRTSLLRLIAKMLSIEIKNIKNDNYVKKTDVSKLINYFKTYYHHKNSRFLGEQLTNWFLTREHIEFIFQKFFLNCKNPKTNRCLPFDFYLPKYNCCIEIDGHTHIENKQVIKRDKIKTEYCKQNNITLIRIKWGYGRYFTKAYLISNLAKQLNKNFGILKHCL